MKNLIAAMAIGLGSVTTQALTIWFDDQATRTLAEFDPNLEGASYQPLQSLSVFNGKESAGVLWSLTIEDAGNHLHSSTLLQWDLKIVGENGSATYSLAAPGVILDNDFLDFELVSADLGPITDINIFLEVEGGVFADLAALTFYSDDYEPSAVLFDYGNLSAVPESLPGVIPMLSLLSLVGADCFRRRFRQ